MTPLPIDLAQPPVLVPFHRLRGLARRLLRNASYASLRRCGRELQATQEPPMPLCSRLQATHIASATYRGLRGFERWVR